MNGSTNGLPGGHCYTTPYVHLRYLKTDKRECRFNKMFNNVNMKFLLKEQKCGEQYIKGYD